MRYNLPLALQGAVRQEGALIAVIDWPTDAPQKLNIRFSTPAFLQEE
ncbi:hypothetical protein [Sphingobium ummariense]